MEGSVSVGEVALRVAAYSRAVLGRALLSATAKDGARRRRLFSALLRKTAQRAAAVLAAARWAADAKGAAPAAQTLAALLAQLEWELEAGCARLFSVVSHLRDAVRAPPFDVPTAARLLSGPHAAPQLPAALFFAPAKATGEKKGRETAALEHCILECLMEEELPEECDEVNVEEGQAVLGSSGYFELRAVPLWIEQKKKIWAISRVVARECALDDVRAELLRRQCQTLATAGGLKAVASFLTRLCGKMRLAAFAVSAKLLPKHVQIFSFPSELKARYWGGEVVVTATESSGLMCGGRRIGGYETLFDIVAREMTFKAERRLRWIASAAPPGTTFSLSSFSPTIGGNTSLTLVFGGRESCWARLAIAADSGQLQLRFSPMFGENVGEKDSLLCRLLSSLSFAEVASAHRILQCKAVLQQSLLVAEAGLFQVVSSSVFSPSIGKNALFDRNAFFLRFFAIGSQFLVAISPGSAAGEARISIFDSTLGEELSGRSVALGDAAEWLAKTVPAKLLNLFFAHQLRDCGFEVVKQEEGEGKIEARLANAVHEIIEPNVTLFPRMVGEKTLLRVRFALLEGVEKPNVPSSFCACLTENVWEYSGPDVPSFVAFIRRWADVARVTAKVRSSFSRDILQSMRCFFFSVSHSPETALVTFGAIEAETCCVSLDGEGGAKANRAFHFCQCLAEMTQYLAACSQRDPVALVARAIEAWPLLAAFGNAMLFSRMVGEKNVRDIGVGWNGDALVLARESGVFVLRYGILFGVKMFLPLLSDTVVLQDAFDGAAVSAKLGPRLPLFEWQSFCANHLWKLNAEESPDNVVGRNARKCVEKFGDSLFFARHLPKVALLLLAYLAASQAWCYAGEVAKLLRFSSVFSPMVGENVATSPPSNSVWQFQSRFGTVVRISFVWLPEPGVTFHVAAPQVPAHYLTLLSPMFGEKNVCVFASVQLLRALLTLLAAPPSLLLILCEHLAKSNSANVSQTQSFQLILVMPPVPRLGQPLPGMPRFPAPGFPAIVLGEGDAALYVLLRRDREYVATVVTASGVSAWS